MTGRCVLDNEPTLGATRNLCVEGWCDPGNNACFATKPAEIWDPLCSESWAMLDAQTYPRMYHSTAILLPNGSVMSAGGGHRQGLEEQVITEFFVPSYSQSLNDVRPNLEIIGSRHLTYAGTLDVTDLAGAAKISRFTLVRLGSVTHQFDMSQMVVDLDFFEVGEGHYRVVFHDHLIADEPDLILADPSALAPPGWYMLFGQYDTGAMSLAQYVHVGDEMGNALASLPVTPLHEEYTCQ